MGDRILLNLSKINDAGNEYIDIGSSTFYRNETFDNVIAHITHMLKLRTTDIVTIYDVADTSQILSSIYRLNSVDAYVFFQ